MELNGEMMIPAPRRIVWQALNDPQVLKDCIAGCQRLERNADGDLDAVVRAKVGPVSATFHGRIAVTDAEPPSRCTLTGEGKSGAAGFARGSADIELTEAGEDTRLGYRADVRVGGKLAQLGGRLVASAGQRYADDFFACLSDRLAGGPATSSADGPTNTAAARAAAAGERRAARHDTSASEAIETFGEKELEENVHLETTFEEELEVEAGKGTLGGPAMWGLIAFAIFVILLIALR